MSGLQPSEHACPEYRHACFCIYEGPSTQAFYPSQCQQSKHHIPMRTLAEFRPCESDHDVQARRPAIDLLILQCCDSSYAFNYFTTVYPSFPPASDPSD